MVVDVAFVPIVDVLCVGLLHVAARVRERKTPINMSSWGI